MGMAGWIQKKFNIPAFTTQKELFTGHKLLSMSEEDYSKLFNIKLNNFRSFAPGDTKQIISIW